MVALISVGTPQQGFQLAERFQAPKRAVRLAKVRTQPPSQLLDR